MLGTLGEVVMQPLLYAVLVAFVFVPLEKLAPLRTERRRALRTDVMFATIGAVLTRGLLFVLAGVTLAGADALSLEGPLSDVPAAIAVPAGLIYFELAGYAYHRLAHASPTLWRFHAVHHSSTTMDWLAGFRQHPVEIALMTLAQNLPLVLLGLPLGAHALVVLFLRLNTLFVHSNLRTPAWLGFLIATPAFHHRHHERDQPSANYATLLPVLDRLLGTWAPGGNGEFGLAEHAPSSFLGLLLAPFRRQRSVRLPRPRSTAIRNR